MINVIFYLIYIEQFETEYKNKKICSWTETTLQTQNYYQNPTNKPEPG